MSGWETRCSTFEGYKKANNESQFCFLIHSELSCTHSTCETEAEAEGWWNEFYIQFRPLDFMSLIATRSFLLCMASKLVKQLKPSIWYLVVPFVDFSNGTVIG